MKPHAPPEDPGNRGSRPGDVAHAVFGARGQLAVGTLAFVASVAAWVYGAGLQGGELLHFLVHVSMAALALAAYAIVATALGYRATERVETAVVENIETAEEVSVG